MSPPAAPPLGQSGSGLETKPWYKSRTLAGLVLIALPIICERFFGLHLNDAAAQAVVENIFQGVGFLMAAWGRLAAEKKLTIAGTPVEPLTKLIVLALCIAIGTSGCSSLTRRGRVTNAVLGNVARFAGKVILASVANAASDRAKGLTLDYAHSASEGLWANAGTIVDSASIDRIVAAWTAGQLGAEGAQLATVFDKARPETPAEKTAVVAAMAKGISDAALSLERPNLASAK